MRLRAWLDAALANLDGEQLDSFDLRRFLQETAAFGVRPEERLRQLAIALETRAASGSIRRDWATLDRVYQHALRLEPDDWLLHWSRSVSACYLAQICDVDPEATHLFAVADSSISRAMALQPDEADLHYTAGYTTYMRGPAHVNEALPSFRRALELNGSHGWARLYLAHCLHDLKRYGEAVAAYDAVPLDAFDGPSSWRTALLVEQRAHCRFMRGDEAGTRAELERAVSRLEKEAHLRLMTSLHWWLGEPAFADLAQRLAVAEAAAFDA